MRTVRGSFQDGVAKPDEPVEGHEGQRVLITFLTNGEADDAGVVDTVETNEDGDFPTIEEVVARIRALGPDESSYIPPTDSLADALASARAEPKIDPAEWDRQWAEIEAEMKRRDLDDDRAEGRI